MPKVGHSRRTTRNVDGDRWRRRAEAYERLVKMIRLAEEYLDADGESVYGIDHPMRALHEALLILNDYRVIEINRRLKGVDEMALWKATAEWKKAAGSIEAIDRAADQIRGQNRIYDPWSYDQAKDRLGDDWPGPLTGDEDE